MSEQKESSVLFSLKELMNLEEDRIRQEETEKQRQVESAERARLEAERRAREEEAARLAAEEERRRVEMQRQREEAARLEAIRQAEIEKARLDAENAARAEAIRQQQDHERKIAALNQDKHKKRLTLILGITGLFLFVAIVGGGLFIKHQQDVAQAEQAKATQELAEKQAAMDKLIAQLKEQQDSVQQLQNAVQNAKDDAARAAALQQLEEAKNRAAETTRTLNTVRSRPAGGGAPPPKKASNCNCTPGDPLCSCIP